MRILGDRLLIAALVLWTCTLPSRADTPLHSLWELHGKHNTVFLLGSIHVLRPGDYPLSPVVMQAYASSKALLMEINLADTDMEQLQAEMLTSAMLPEGKSLQEVLGPKRYARAESLARDVGVELATFDGFAPWFAAEAISQLQLLKLGFEPTAGVEMYFLERARSERLAIVCSEADPEHCHRRLLVGKVLTENGVQLRHILADCNVRSECRVPLPRYTQETLFGEGETPWRSTQSVLHRRAQNTFSID